MEFMTGEKKRTDISVAELLSGRLDGEQVTMRGMVHIIRDMGEVSFLILRKAEGLVQCVCSEAVFQQNPCKEEAAIEVTGIVHQEQRAPGGYEIRLESTGSSPSRRKRFRFRLTSGR